MTDLRNPSGIIFDMDGVLVNSTSCHREAFEQIFRRFGITQFDYPEYAGRRTAEVIQDVLMGAGLQEPPDVITQLAREKSRLALHLFEDRKPVVPGCEAVLAELAARCPIGLASSGSRASVASFLRTTGTASIFGCVLTGEDVAHAKPDPEIYIQSAKRLRLNASQCIVVEDAVSGVIAARAAGASVVGIPGTSSAEELRSAGADFTVLSLAEIAEFLSPAAAIDPGKWTAVIPAAGRGSRLGFHLPKILYPVGGRPILDWLLDYLIPYCGRFVFVLSPEGNAEVAQELDRRMLGRLYRHPAFAHRDGRCSRFGIAAGKDVSYGGCVGGPGSVATEVRRGLPAPAPRTAGPGYDGSDSHEVQASTSTSSVIPPGTLFGSSRHARVRRCRLRAKAIRDFSVSTL